MYSLYLSRGRRQSWRSSLYGTDRRRRFLLRACAAILWGTAAILLVPLSATHAESPQTQSYQLEQPKVGPGRPCKPTTSVLWPSAEDDQTIEVSLEAWNDLYTKPLRRSEVPADLPFRRANELLVADDLEPIEGLLPDS